MGKPQSNEKDLARLWQRQTPEADPLLAGDGSRLRVVFPGRRNRGRGPDFRGAILATSGGERLAGDVELHRRATDFRAHGHHSDRHYNDLALHVVIDDNGEGTTTLESGRRVPVVALEAVARAVLPLSPGDDPYTPLPCRDAAQRLGRKPILALLQSAGEARFLERARQYRALLADGADGEQVLYEGLLECLGYSKNRVPFRELARRLPLARLRLRLLPLPLPQREALLLAVLFGAAGLAGPVRPLDEAALADWTGEPLTAADWSCHRVRPCNAPAHRLLGAAGLILRYLEIPLPQDLGALLKAGSLKEAAIRMQRGLEVGATGSPPAAAKGPPVGPGRAAEMVVNVALPFLYAYEEGKRVERALEVYRSCPRAGGNEVTRYMSYELLGSGAPSAVAGACQEQGLMHLSAAFCRELRCGCCPVNREAKPREA